MALPIKVAVARNPAMRAASACVMVLIICAFIWIDACCSAVSGWG